ncbi:MAG: O-antigen ligase family protein [Opitutaceae bacterium]|jgi:O-antigen ligase
MSLLSPGGVPAFFGFDERDPEARSCFGPAAALALALAVLPFLLLLLVDTDRTVPLAFLPAVWLGWKTSKPARRADAWLLAWAVIAMIVSAAFAPHTARALVMTSAVGWTLAGTLVARNIAGCPAAIRLVLTGIVTGAMAGVVMVRLGAGAERMDFPTYWSARLLGAHQFAGAISVLPLLFFIPPSHRALRILATLAAVIIWTGLAWSGSRAPAMGLAVTLILWFWRGSSVERRFLLLWVPVLSVTALSLSYPLGTPYAQLGWWNAFTRTAHATSVEAISSERTHFWSVTLKHALTSPWIGHGADNYLYIHPNQNGNQPHNVLLQWFLEYGLFGAVPLVLLVVRGMSGLLTPAAHTGMATRPFNIWACSALAGAAAYGLFDGVFYHMIVFMPVAVIAGFAIGQRNPDGPAGFVIRNHAIGRGLLMMALGFLLLHNWLYLVLIKGSNITPDSPPARILRIFPSSTYGLNFWIERWRATQPDVAMEWIKWAEEASIAQGSFHVYAAQLYIWKKDYKSAEMEMLRCLGKVHYTERPDVIEVLANVRRLAAEQAAKAASESSSTQTAPSP